MGKRRPHEILVERLMAETICMMSHGIEEATSQQALNVLRDIIQRVGDALARQDQRQVGAQILAAEYPALLLEEHKGEIGDDSHKQGAAIVVKFARLEHGVHDLLVQQCSTR